MIKQENKNEYDKLLYLLSILKRLDCGDVDSFQQRFKSQKTQYFAQLFGVSFRYPFNLYIKGPYSPELARDLYLIKKEGFRAVISRFIPEELERRMAFLKKYIGDMNDRQMEIVATYHWLVKVAGLPAVNAKDKLKELKRVSDSETDYVENKLILYERIKENFG